MHDANFDGYQLVGLRFPHLHIPEGAIITEPTHLVFQLDREANRPGYVCADGLPPIDDDTSPTGHTCVAGDAVREPLTVVIYAEDTDSSAEFTATAHDLSDRPAAQSSVIWQPGTVNEDGCEPAPRCGDHSPQCVLRGNPRSCRPQCWATPGCTVSTPDLSHLVQEVLTPQPDGHTITFVIAHISGNGVRWMDSDNRNAGPDSPWTPMLVYSFTKPSNIPDLQDTVRPVEETITVGSTANTAEENVADGSMYLDSSDLELMSDGSEQVVGVRFENVNIPQSAVLASARVTFEVDEVQDASADRVVVAIFAEDADNAAPISGTAFDLSTRTPTKQSVIWSPGTTDAQPDPCSYDLGALADDVDAGTLLSYWCPISCGQARPADDYQGELAARGWGTCGELIDFIATSYLDNPWAQVGQQVSTPNIAALVEAVVNRPGWVSGNALMILFGHVSGSGVRWVESSTRVTPALTYDLLLTPNVVWSPGPGTASATLVAESQMCGSCMDDGDCTGYKSLDKGSLAACAHATEIDPACGTYFHCDRTDPPCERGCDCALALPFGGDDCASRTAHPAGADVGIDIYHLDSAPIVDPNRCDETTFPDLDTSVMTGICGECKVLVNHFNSVYESSCRVYCESMGRTCVGAWEEVGDTCQVAREEACHSKPANWGGTSDAICECGDDPTAVPLPPPPPPLGAGNRCDETTFPDLDTSVMNGICGECKVLVNHFNSVYESSCRVYCESMGRTCVGAWEEDGDTCAVLRDESCDSPVDNWGGTSDAICECSDAQAGGGH